MKRDRVVLHPPTGLRLTAYPRAGINRVLGIHPYWTRDFPNYSEAQQKRNREVVASAMLNKTIYRFSGFGPKTLREVAVALGLPVADLPRVPRCPHCGKEL